MALFIWAKIDISFYIKNELIPPQNSIETR